MKRLQLFLMSIPFLFLSCSDGSTKSDNNISSTKIAKEQQSFEKLQQSSFIKKSYFFASDTICQSVCIKVLKRSAKYDGIPEKLEFVILLNNKLMDTQAEIKGVATLTSPNESFFVETNPDSGAYFAADYNKNSSPYTINISLDIERYEACAISIKDNNNTLADYLKYLKKFPDYYIMKLGTCK